MTPHARLLDITRLSSRIGRVFTGVDRVELAYLRAVHADPVPGYAIARTALGYVVLDDAGIGALLQRISEGDFPKPDFVSRVNRRLHDSAKVGQTLLRGFAVKRCLRRRLPRLLQAVFPDGFSYLNVGHSNLTDHMLISVGAQREASVTVLIHDTIPLDFPLYQRAGAVDAFAAKVRRVSKFADQVICISDAGRSDVRRHLEHQGRVPDLVTAHLGVELPKPEPFSHDIPNVRPYFVTVGTIEARKNHALLLDVWERLGPAAPSLFVCGARGWANDDVLARLDRGVSGVHVLHDLSDGALAGLIADAQGLLFPTFAEGFGLPPHEALARGTAVVCSDLPVLRETLGDHAIFLDPNDRDAWAATVTRLAEADGSQGKDRVDPPTWDAHFKIVFTMT